jgi:hypothetical protein
VNLYSFMVGLIHRYVKGKLQGDTFGWQAAARLDQKTLPQRLKPLVCWADRRAEALRRPKALMLVQACVRSGLFSSGL